MVTILDAHPDVAMSYEFYPELLRIDDPSPAFLKRMIQRLQWPFFTLRMLTAWVGSDSFYRYVRRLPQAGLSKHDFIELLREQVAAGMGFGTTGERLRFVERCCVLKMKRSGKRRWAEKHVAIYDYLAVWPDAHFINVIRDGRDVLASRLNTGDFDKDPVNCARGWSGTVKAFEAFAQRHPQQAHPVIYEELVTNLEGVLKTLCARTGLEFTPRLLRYYEQAHTLYNTRHLSRDRVAKPVDSRSIGRWRRDLTAEQLEAFYSGARETLARYGYLRPGETAGTGV